MAQPMFTLTLPPPSLQPNNPHLASALRHISAATIPHSQRNILRAAALHATNPQFLVAIPCIHDPAELDYLATLCRRALIAFKNQGGRPQSIAATPASSDSPISRVDSGPQPPTAQTPPGINPQTAINLHTHRELTALCALFNLGPATSLFPATFTTPPLHRIFSSRPTGFADALKLRDNTPHCLITGASINLVGAHIIPHSLIKTAAAPSPGQISFWLFLTFFLGTEVRDKLWRFLSEDEAVGNGCANGVCLGEAMHVFFDTGVLTLEPLHPREADNGRTSMEVLLKWHHWERELSLYQTILSHIADQTETTGEDIGHRMQASPLHNGDIFTIKTRDAQNYPLPVRGLLQLHDLLWTVIAAAGLLIDPGSAPTEKWKQQPRKRKRFHKGKDPAATTTTPMSSEYPTPTTQEPSSATTTPGSSEYPTPVEEISQSPPPTSSSHQQRSVSGSSTQSSQGSTASTIFDVSPYPADHDADNQKMSFGGGKRLPHAHRETSSSPPPVGPEKRFGYSKDIDALSLPRKRKLDTGEAVSSVAEEQKDEGNFDDQGHQLGSPGISHYQLTSHVSKVVSTKNANEKDMYIDYNSASKLDCAIELFGEYWPTGQRSRTYNPKESDDCGTVDVVDSTWEDEGGEEDEEEQDGESDDSDSDEVDCQNEWTRGFDQHLMSLVVGL